MRRLLACSALLALGLVAACSINVDKDAMGGLTVNSGEVTAADTGLAAYPGAAPIKDDDENSAHVAMNFPGFKMNVLAAKYQSADARPKVLDFYRKELARYGKVIECEASHGGNLNIGKSSNGKDLDRPVDCSNGDGHGGVHINVNDKNAADNGSITLKVGKQGDQHDVSVETKDGKTVINLVRVLINKSNTDNPV